MYTPHDENDTWLSVPRWLWRLIIPAGSILTAWLALLLIPAVAAVMIVDTVFHSDPGGECAEPGYVMMPPPQPPDPPLFRLDINPPLDDRCPDTLAELSDYTADGAFRRTCRCTPEMMKETGSVWGTDTYTSDSNVCAAAHHAGVLDQRGGEVTVVAGPGCSSYAGSTRHGVSTTAYGSWTGSFYFPKVSQGGCAP